MNNENQPSESDLKKFAGDMVEIFKELTVREATEANRKLDKIAGLLVQVAFSIGGLASLRVVGLGWQELPMTHAGIVLVALSIVAGIYQLSVDYGFFERSAGSSRDVATAAYAAYSEPNASTREALASAVKAHGALPKKTGFCPLIIQGALLLIAFVGILLELSVIVT